MEKDYVTEVHIADIHFGSVPPDTAFKILYEQFIQKIATISFDILSIDGDLFDKRYMANSEAVFYAMKFVKTCAELCMVNNATMIIIAGTESHDAGQLQLFYGYVNDTNLDIRIVESIQFQYVKGLKILCIPEEYNKGEDYYMEYLNDVYDTAFMHGTVVGSVYGANTENLNSTKYPIFGINSFAGCRGPIICGHVHKAMCLNGYIYYCSNPIRYKFGEEEPKGFCIVLHNKKTGYHVLEFIEIKSFRYDTIDIRDLNHEDPNVIIAYLNDLLQSGVDNIRLDFSKLDNTQTQYIIAKYYQNSGCVKIKPYQSVVENVSAENVDSFKEKYSDLGFLLDQGLDDYSKFVKYVNYNMGSQYITVDKLKSLLSSV